MRFFGSTFRAQFLSRPNRFLVRCRWKGETISVFLPNPGRLQELLLPGRVVYLTEEKSAGERKTRYTAVAVEREGHPVMLHTHRTNGVARHLLENSAIPGLEGAEILKSEVGMGRSRFDFLLRQDTETILLEVKSCTLFGKETAMFPDAVTERGARHLAELAALSRKGMRTAVVFIVHWPFSRIFMPDYHTDLNFSLTLVRTRTRVQVIPVSVGWNQDLTLSQKVRLLHIPWDYIKREARDRGSYILVLKLRNRRNIPVGCLGTLSFPPGFYIYVGSAMANLESRMERHRHLRKRHHWHIDELRAAAEFHSLQAVRSSDRLECEIARALSRIADWEVSAFGASDCSCKTHLFGMAGDPIFRPDFHSLLQHFRMDRFAETPK
ncbi:MAG: DNA/RNA nuclease SfsA [Armatimonadetes bacterium]|nr:DNA/RNA nuclease SfsA [Armatimonadota bacterium]